MAKKMTKKQRREIEKVAKKHPVLITVILLIIVAIGVCCFLHWKGIIHIPFLDKIIPQQQEDDIGESLDIDAVGGTFTEATVTEIKSGDVSIHFLELGNKYTGDCTLIKVGDTEVLIDAGSIKSSAATIVPYVRQYCTDGVLEYVIATHAHQDHIAGFVGTTKADGVLESFVCETIIDYALSDSKADIRTEYEELRDEEVKAGAKHYTALECVQGINGAQSVYTLGEGVTLKILDQRFYSEKAEDENDYSVCTLLTEKYAGGENNYLFTGDLEEHGEASLVEENNLPKVRLFKAGHHGSYTASTSALLSVIQPDIVAVCCCCGSDEYTETVANQFPSQTFVDNVAPYTSQVYVTTIVADNKDGYESMNGNIVIVSLNGEIKVRCSNNVTLFKDTDWFKKHRTTPKAWAS